jgi:hypothetical protein
MRSRLILAVLCALFLGVLCPATKGFAASPQVAEQIDEPVTLDAVLSAKGSTLLSFPLDLGDLDVGAWLVAAGVSSRGIHGWDARLQKYVQLKGIRPGQGFLLAHGPGKIPVTGRRLTTPTLEVSLHKGWNVIGVPFETSLPLAALRVVLDGKTENFSAALEKKWIGGVNALVDGNTVPLSPATAALDPWRGYWLYAYQPCQLIIPDVQRESEAKARKGQSSKKP